MMPVIRPKLAAKSRAQKSKSIHCLKISLLGIKPQIWRRIEVDGDIELSRLQRILLVGMGWTEGHLHQFCVGNSYYGVPHPDDFEEILDESKVTLAEVAPKVKDGFRRDTMMFQEPIHGSGCLVLPPRRSCRLTRERPAAQFSVRMWMLPIGWD
jgi:hypothetical protein